MDERILKRIDRAAGVDDLAGVLAGLSPTDLQSLLLEVYRRRVGRMTAKDVLARYEQSRFVSPASADVADLLEFDRRALALAPASYEAIELSPVAPLGAVAVLARLNQDWAVATARNSEVVSDSTNILALECAHRRRRNRAAAVKLIASHRLLRGQDYQGRVQSHFRLLGLAAAGRGREFEVDAVVEQLSFYRRLLGDVRIAITPLDDTLAAAVSDRMGGMVTLDTARAPGRAYYVGLCFKLYGGAAELGDGGFVDWTRTLLGDRKEALLISGVGAERALAHARPTPTPDPVV